MQVTTSIPRKEGFFFGTEVPYGLAVVRILLSVTLLAVMLPRWYHARELFSSDGSAAPLTFNYGLPNLTPIPSGTVAVALASLLILTLITSCLGWCTRTSILTSLVLYTYLNLLDCLGTLTKYSVIASHGLFILSLSGCGAVWSIDSVLKRRKAARSPDAEPLPPPALPVWPRRLMQLLIGLVYLGAAFTKMHTPAFFSSDQMRFWMLTNVNHYNPVGEALSFYPAVLVASAYITILFETLFIFLAWRGWWRPVLLATGVFFHVMTLLTLGLYVFPAVCCSIYFSFLNEQDVERIKGWLARLTERGNRLAVTLSWIPQRLTNLISDTSPRSAAGIFGVLVLIFVVGGIETEYQLDPFGTRRAEGAHELVRLDTEKARSMLRMTEPIREKDKYLFFSMGSDMLGNVLLDQQFQFRHGERIFAQCVLTPPHEDMYIECNLHEYDPGYDEKIDPTPEDRLGPIIDRVGQVIARDTLRASWSFDMLESLTPGKYCLAVRSSGKVITTRTFELLPD